jgi:hypothetical protein
MPPELLAMGFHAVAVTTDRIHYLRIGLGGCSPGKCDAIAATSGRMRYPMKLSLSFWYLSGG